MKGNQLEWVTAENKMSSPFTTIDRLSQSSHDVLNPFTVCLTPERFGFKYTKCIHFHIVNKVHSSLLYNDRHQRDITVLEGMAP